MRERQIVTANMLRYLFLIGISMVLAVVGLMTDFLYPIGAILAILFLVYIIKRPFAGFLLYVMMVYLRPADVMPVLATAKVQFLLLALLIVLWLFDQFIIRKEKVTIERLDYPMFAFLGAMGVSLISSFYLAESINFFDEFLRFMVFWVLASQVLKTERHLKQFIWVIVGCVAFVIAIQIWTYLTIGLTRATGLGGYGIHIGPLNLDTERSILGGGADENVHGVGGYSAGFLANASELGLGVLVMLPFLYYLLPTLRSSWHRAMVVGLIALFFASLVVCGARGAFVGVVAVLFVVFLRSRHKIAIALTLLIAFAVVVPLLPAQYIDRIASTANYEEDESANIRLTLWTAGLHMLIDRPILGVGVGCFNTAYGSKYRPAGSADLWWEPHNIFVQVSSEMGLVGLGIFVWLLVTIFLENRRSREMLAQLNEGKSFLYHFSYAIDLGLIGYIVSGCFITSLYFPHPYLMALLARSTSVILRERVAAIERHAAILHPEMIPQTETN